MNHISKTSLYQCSDIGINKIFAFIWCVNKIKSILTTLSTCTRCSIKGYLSLLSESFMILNINYYGKIVIIREKGTLSWRNWAYTMPCLEVVMYVSCLSLKQEIFQMLVSHLSAKNHLHMGWWLVISISQFEYQMIALWQGKC